MEIDFLGLNTPSPSCNLEQQESKNPYAEAAGGGGGVEISLSLSTSSSLNFSELQLQRKKWHEKMVSSSCSGATVCSLASYNLQEKVEQLPSTLLVVAPPVFRQPAAAAGFLYDLNANDAAATVNLRNMNIHMSPLSTHEPASLAMLYPFPQPDQKVDQIQNKFYVSAASTGNNGAGHTPTVAMARRATLARFLEKRLHRMNQARASHMIGRSKTLLCDPKNNKRSNNHLKIRSSAS